MLVGLALQIAGLIMLVVIPTGSFALAALAVAIYAAGFSIFKPFMDSILAEVTEGRSRASIYALNNTFISLVGSGVAVLSGYLFSLWPPAVWIASAVILVGCSAILFSLRRAEPALADGAARCHNPSQGCIMPPSNAGRYRLTSDDGKSRSPTG